MLSQKFSDSVAAWRAIENSTPEQIADAALAVWGDISVALSPVIGERGVIALFKRSLHLVRVEYPPLNVMGEATMRLDEFTALHAELTKRTAIDAITFNSAVLNTFHSLLSRLIGATLTGQLLNSVVDTPSAGDPAQDTLS